MLDSELFQTESMTLAFSGLKKSYSQLGSDFRSARGMLSLVCGCALEKAGFTLHLHHIRSFEKLTGEGMSYYYGGLFELLETTFPCEFGGSLGDYQLVEEEDGNGQTRLTLVVHPDVGELDEVKSLARLRDVLADESRSNQFMTGVWENAGTFRVRRENPYASPRGKILPLHLNITSS